MFLSCPVARVSSLPKNLVARVFLVRTVVKSPSDSLIFTPLLFPPKTTLPSLETENTKNDTLGAKEP